jgi:hypothetical protein
VDEVLDQASGQVGAQPQPAILGGKRLTTDSAAVRRRCSTL